MRSEEACCHSKIQRDGKTSGENDLEYDACDLLHNFTYVSSEINNCSMFDQHLCCICSALLYCLVKRSPPTLIQLKRSSIVRINNINAICLFLKTYIILHLKVRFVINQHFYCP